MRLSKLPACEIVVVGAGAAGLAAAAELAAARRQVLVLEARERVGGRCFTRRMAGLDIPVEVGAEFIHGEARSTHELLRAAGIKAVDSVREQRTLERGRLRPINGFLEAQRAVQGASLDRDVSFAEFLRRRRVPEKTKALATLMVQGFDAADPKRVSARSIIEEWGEGGELGASQQPRPQGGYGPLMEWLARSLVARGVPLRLQSVVQRIEWRRGSVLVHGRFLGEPFTVRAQRAVITLPLGVLQSRAVTFSPSLGKAAALLKLASGPVIRVAMRFDHRFWEAKAPGVAFFHNPKGAFPTFWTPLPMRAALLTAWAGGPKAQRLTGSGERRLVASALASVRSIFPNAGEPLAAHVQDWQQDPFARGGYSYVLVNGESARARLAAPVEETLFFAGEATESQEPGTVAGALMSGQRAAREILGR